MYTGKYTCMSTAINEGVGCTSINMNMSIRVNTSVWAWLKCGSINLSVKKKKLHKYE